MKKLRVNPKEIHLHDVPEEGQTYCYTRESGELNAALEDVIGSNDYQVDLEVRPIGNAWEVYGKVETKMDLVCSRCAIDFKHPIKETFQEVVVIAEEMPRAGKTARVNHTTELAAEGPDYMVLNSDVFSVPEFLHEIIALAEPIRPLGRPNCDESCENLKEAYNQGWLKSSEGELEGKGTHKPFTILKDMKLNS